MARGDGLLNHDLLPGEQGPQDACGVFGVYAPGGEVAKLTYFGLYALQHRGQESAGIAASAAQRTTGLAPSAKNVRADMAVRIMAFPPLVAFPALSAGLCGVGTRYTER